LTSVSQTTGTPNSASAAMKFAPGQPVLGVVVMVP